LTKKLAEAREREKRERNLVFVNIKESAAAAATDRKREDIAEVKKVLDKVVQLAEDEIQEVFRLGQVGGNKPRLLKVVVKDKEKKYEILRKSKDLNQGINDPRKKVFVNPDYSKEQRQANKELREEFKRRVGQGEKDIKIIKGKIVKLENKGGWKETQPAVAEANIANDAGRNKGGNGVEQVIPVNKGQDVNGQA
jgi:hypothetical protein